MSDRIRVILEQDGLKITRNPDDAHIKDRDECEHRLTREGGFGAKFGTVLAAVQAVKGVSHAYVSRAVDGGTIFYGLTNDEPGQYDPVARRVIQAAKAVL